MYQPELEFPDALGEGGGGGVFKKIPSVGELWTHSGTAQSPQDLY